MLAYKRTGQAPYNSYLSRAVKKDLEFTLTKQHYTSFTTEKCYYCDKESSETHKNGIDRKDNAFGYILSNCVSCCRECNYMKGSLTDDEFIGTCKRVSQYNLENNIIFPKIDKCENIITKRKKHDIPKEKIVVTKQQPNKSKLKV